MTWLYKSKVVTAVVFAAAVVAFAYTYPKAFGLCVTGTVLAGVVWLVLWATEDRP